MLYTLLASALLAAPPERFTFRETHMAMPFEMALYAGDEQAATKAAAAAFARIHEIEERLSDYNADSELNQLCETSGSDRAVKVSHDLFAVLEQSRSLSEKSGGAFDPTIGPAVRLWRKARRRKLPPTPEEIRLALLLVDHRQMVLDKARGTVELRRAGTKLDLGGIAAGYAVDQALAVLRSHGISSAMIDASGDIGVSDSPPGTNGWRIGVAPLDAKGPPSRFVVLRSAAVTTSGDAFQFVEFGGIRYSHIVDPKTGLGLTTRSSVTVIAPDCTTADSHATAACVLGPVKGRALIEDTPGAAAIFVVAGEAGSETVVTKGWDAYSADAPALPGTSRRVR